MNARADRTLIVTIPGLAADQIQDLFKPDDRVEVSENRGLLGLQDFVVNVGIDMTAQVGAAVILQAAVLVRKLIVRAREHKLQSISAAVPTAHGTKQLSHRLDTDPATDEDFVNKVTG